MKKNIIFESLKKAQVFCGVCIDTFQDIRLKAYLENNQRKIKDHKLLTQTPGWNPEVIETGVDATLLTLSYTSTEVLFRNDAAKALSAYLKKEIEPEKLTLCHKKPIYPGFDNSNVNNFWLYDGHYFVQVGRSNILLGSAIGYLDTEIYATEPCTEQKFSINLKNIDFLSSMQPRISVEYHLTEDGDVAPTRIIYFSADSTETDVIKEYNEENGGAQSMEQIYEDVRLFEKKRKV